MGNFIDLIILFGLIALGYFAGTRAERRHYRSIREREEKYLTQPAITFGKFQGQEEVAEARLVSGSVVISVDYFKRLLAGLRALVGGRIKSYESLLDRARREALLRMKEQAEGADAVVNLRIETTSISKGARRKNTVSTVEALAYGTALYRRK